jgi:hypothetical protein
MGRRELGFAKAVQIDATKPALYSSNVNMSLVEWYRIYLFRKLIPTLFGHTIHLVFMRVIVHTYIPIPQTPFAPTVSNPQSPSHNV